MYPLKKYRIIFIGLLISWRRALKPKLNFYIKDNKSTKKIWQLRKIPDFPYLERLDRITGHFPYA